MPPCPKPTRRKHSKSERTKLEADNDRLFSLIVRWRDPDCVLCGRPTTCVSHFVKRGKQEVRWDLKNGAGSDDACNSRHNYYPQRYTAWFIARYGAAEHKRMVEAEERKKWKWDVLQLRDINANLRRLWENRPSVWDDDLLHKLGYFG